MAKQNVFGSRKRKTGLSINFNPTEKQLENLSDLYYAIDLLIVQDAFMGQNPMKHQGQGILFWDWAIVKVCGVEIPVPIHTYTEDTCVLYNWNDDEFIISKKECALATGVYYLNTLLDLSRDIDAVLDAIPMIFHHNLYNGLKAINNLGHEKVVRMIMKMQDNFEGPAWRILD